MKSFSIICFSIIFAATFFVSGCVTDFGINFVSESTLATAFETVNYSATLQVTGGSGGYTFTYANFAPSTPGGLSFNADGTINSAPNASTAGTYTFDVTVEDRAGNSSTRSFTLKILSNLDFTCSSADTAGVGNPYTFTFSASGGTAPYTWAYTYGTPNPPAKFTFNTTNGLCSTTSNPVVGDVGTYSITVVVTDSGTGVEQQNDTLNFTLTVSNIGDGSNGYTVDNNTTLSGYTAITGTILTTANIDDGTYSLSMATIAPGFDFSYYGTAVTAISCCTNGWISMSSTTSTTWTNYAIPNSTAPNNIIMPYFDDLYCGYSTINTRFRYQVQGSAPNRIIVIDYNHFRWLNNSTNYLTFQARLYETTNIIEFYYNTADWNHFTSATASIGIENAAGTAGVAAIPSTTATQPTLNYRFRPIP